MFRFRSRDHVVVTIQDNPTGRTGPRIRCVGRTDDMLIVRGVNLFPTAVRNVLEDFSAETSGMFNIQPGSEGVLQDPPLPIAIEVTPGSSPENRDLAARIEHAIKDRLLVTSKVLLVAHGTLPRETYKSKLVDYSKATKAVA